MRIRKKKFLFVVGVVVCAMLVASKLLLVWRADEPKRYYKKQLASLDTATSGITPAAQLHEANPKDISDNLKRYNNQLDTVLNLCRPLITEEKAFTAKITDQRLKDTIHNSAQLCNDLTAVAAYSEDVYKSSGEYIKFSLQWPAVDSPDYLNRLNQLSDVVKLTGIDMRGIDNSKVNDPGLEELISHIDDSGRQIEQIKTSLRQPDLSTAQRQSDQLVDMLNRDKTNFLSARGYFWNNTIGIEDLKNAIQNLRDQIK